MADANYSDVSLLLHCNGADASTTFNDTGPGGRTVTVFSPAQIDTAQFKYGAASGLFDGNNAVITVPDAAAFDFGSGNFTIELWFRVTSFTNTPASRLLLVGKSDGDTPWEIDIDPGTSRVRAYVYNTGAGIIAAINDGTTLSTNTWYHVALTRSGTSIKLFVGGVESAGTYTSSAALYVSTGAAVHIGGYYNGGTYSPFYGHIDDVRITKGVARYTTGFTPPTAEFEEGAPAAIDARVAQNTGPLSLDANLLAVQSASVRVAADSPLGVVMVLARAFHALAAAESPLGAVSVVGFSNFASRLASEALQKHRYYMDLVTPGGNVRVPISSWQATQQTLAQCYAGCVIPACEPWVDSLVEATAFVISRAALTLSGEEVEVEFARCDLETLQIDTGPTNQTASISGYFDAVAENNAPAAIYDRTLQDVRSISAYSSGSRVRCGIDWMLRPAQRALYADTSMVVSSINYYVTQNSGGGVQAYMDLIERIV